MIPELSDVTTQRSAELEMKHFSESLRARTFEDHWIQLSKWVLDQSQRRDKKVLALKDGCILGVGVLIQQIAVHSSDGGAKLRLSVTFLSLLKVSRDSGRAAFEWDLEGSAVAWKVSSLHF